MHTLFTLYCQVHVLNILKLKLSRVSVPEFLSSVAVRKDYTEASILLTADFCLHMSWQEAVAEISERHFLFMGHRSHSTATDLSVRTKWFSLRKRQRTALDRDQHQVTVKLKLLFKLCVEWPVNGAQMPHKRFWRILCVHSCEMC